MFSIPRKKLQWDFAKIIEDAKNLSELQKHTRICPAGQEATSVVFSKDCPRWIFKLARSHLNPAPIIFISKIWEVQDIRFLHCNFQQDRPINFGDILIRDFSRIRFSPFIPGTIINRLNRCLKITMSEKSYRNHCKSKNRDFRKSHYLPWKTWFPVGIQIGIEKT